MNGDEREEDIWLQISRDRTRTEQTGAQVHAVPVVGMLCDPTSQVPVEVTTLAPAFLLALTPCPWG